MDVLDITVDDLSKLCVLKMGIGTTKKKLKEIINFEGHARMQFALTDDFTIWLHYAGHHEEFQSKQGIRYENIWIEGNIHTVGLKQERYIVVQCKSTSPTRYVVHDWGDEKANLAHIRFVYVCTMKILDYLEPLHTHPHAHIRRPYINEHGRFFHQDMTRSPYSIALQTDT